MPSVEWRGNHRWTRIHAWIIHPMNHAYEWSACGHVCAIGFSTTIDKPKCKHCLARVARQQD